MVRYHFSSRFLGHCLLWLGANTPKKNCNHFHVVILKAANTLKINLYSKKKFWRVFGANAIKSLLKRWMLLFCSPSQTAFKSLSLLQTCQTIFIATFIDKMWILYHDSRLHHSYWREGKERRIWNFCFKNIENGKLNGFVEHTAQPWQNDF